MKSKQELLAKVSIPQHTRSVALVLHAARGHRATGE